VAYCFLTGAIWRQVTGGAMEHPIEGIIREAYAAFARGDLDGYFRACMEDWNFNIAGKGAIAGTYHGKQGLYELAQKAMATTSGRNIALSMYTRSATVSSPLAGSIREISPPSTQRGGRSPNRPGNRDKPPRNARTLSEARHRAVTSTIGRGSSPQTGQWPGCRPTSRQPARRKPRLPPRKLSCARRRMPVSPPGR
jgi:hypothetical protein